MWDQMNQNARAASDALVGGFNWPPVTTGDSPGATLTLNRLRAYPGEVEEYLPNAPLRPVPGLAETGPIWHVGGQSVPIAAEHDPPLRLSRFAPPSRSCSAQSRLLRPDRRFPWTLQ